MKLLDIFNIFKRKKKTEDDYNIRGEEICRMYYLMKAHEDYKSLNYGVVKNKKKFEWQLKVWKEKLNKINGDRMMKISDDHYRFIINEHEVNIIHIRRLRGLEEDNLMYKKYM